MYSCICIKGGGGGGYVARVDLLVWKRTGYDKNGKNRKREQKYSIELDINQATKKSNKSNTHKNITEQYFGHGNKNNVSRTSEIDERMYIRLIKITKIKQFK